MSSAGALVLVAVGSAALDAALAHRDPKPRAVEPNGTGRPIRWTRSCRSVDSDARSVDDTPLMSREPAPTTYRWSRAPTEARSRG